MSLFDQQKAPQDTVIQQNVPTQNINVSGPGRFYPEEFSGQIRAVEQQQSNLAEIPKTLASITEKVNDYRRSIWAEEEQTNINKQNIQNQNALELRKAELDLAINNSIYDMSEQMNQAILDTTNQADIDDARKFDALNEVLADYENPDEFANSPAAKQKWQSVYRQKTAETLYAARQSDIETEQYKAKANIVNSINKGYSSVMQGLTSETSAMQAIVAELSNYIQILPAKDAQELLNQAWNNVVLARAKFIIDAQEKGLPGYSNEAASQALRALLSESTAKVFETRDTQGNTITGKDGKAVTFTVTLKPDVQNELIRNFKTAGTSNAGNVKANQVVSNFDEIIGYESLNKLGFSPELTNLQEMDLVNKYMTDAYAIQTGNAKDDTKRTQLENLTNHFVKAHTVKSISNLATYAGENTRPIVKKVMDKLSSDIEDYNKDWVNYTLKIPMGDTTFTVPSPAQVLGADYVLSMGNAHDFCYLYWKEAAKTFSKTSSLISNGQLGSLLYYSDTTYKKAYDETLKLMNKASLVDTSKDGALSNLKAQLNILTQRPKELGYGYQAIPVDKLQILVESLNDASRFPDMTDKYKASKVLMEALHQTGHIADFGKYITRNGGNIEPAEEAITMFSLVTTGDTGLIQKFDNIFGGKKSQKDIDTINNSRSNKELSDSNILEINNEIFKDLGIPSEHRSWYSDLSQKCAIVVADETEIDGDGTRKYTEYMKKLLQDKYARLPKVKNKVGSFFKYSPQMQLYNTPEGEAKLTERLNKTKEFIDAQSRNLNIHNKTKDWMWCSNDDLNAITLCDKNGNLLEVTLGTGEREYYGLVLDSEDFGKIDNRILSTLSAQAALAGLLVSDDEARKEAFKATVTLTHAERKPLHEGFRDKLELIPTRSLQELYYNDSDKFHRDILAIAKTIMDPLTFKKIAQDSMDISSRNKGGLDKAIMYPDNKIIRAIGGFRDINDQVTKYFEGQNKEFGPVITYSLLEQEVIQDQKIFENIITNSNYVGKVNQGNISIPISYAALGNVAYTDIYNISEAGGYTISGTNLPSVINTGNAEFSPTGFMLSLTGSRQKAPTITSKKYEKAEINQMIDYYAHMWGIPVALARAVVKQESAYSGEALSKAGAQGYMQLMPATAKELGVTDSWDPAQNIWGGMKYLSMQYKRFGSWELALAAYNAGPGAVEKYKGIPNYKETKEYVQKIMTDYNATTTDKFAVNYAIADNKDKFIDRDTNMLSLPKLDTFIDMTLNKEGFKNRVRYISTNRPELLEDKPEYSDYKKYRQLKSSDGKPLFRFKEYEGFSVQLDRDTKQYSIDKAAAPALAEDAVKTQTNLIETIEKESMEALISTVKDKYKCDPFSAQDLNQPFGLAGLTASEYEDYGIPLSYMYNPVMQTRALCQEFQRAYDILGTERKALFAIYGGSFINADKEIKAWSEIKNNPMDHRKEWFIHPSADAKERVRINNLMSEYNKEYTRIRGIV